LVVQTIDSSSQRTTSSKRHIVPECGMRVRISDLSMRGVTKTNMASILMSSKLTKRCRDGLPLVQNVVRGLALKRVLQ